MKRSLFWKVLFIHLFAKNLVYAAPAAWAFEHIQSQQAQELIGDQGLHAVTVAVIDTGVDTGHPALRSQLWTNPGEIPNNQIDDDRNGYVDDIHGWNFAQNNNDLKDHQGHGTHIAGLIAGQSQEFRGVAPQAKLMILKYYDPKLSAIRNLENSIQAFRYAVMMKVQIINFSGGGPGSNPEEESILRLAEQNKILVIAAAGNESLDTDRFPYFPANYPLANILSISSTDSAHRISGFSNYGLKSAHLAAPGENIRSTAVGGGYTELSGTSQATALASGLAALILSRHFLTPSQVIARIKAGSRFQEALSGRMAAPGILNAYRTLAIKGTQDLAVEIDIEFDSDTQADSDFIVKLDPSQTLPHLERQEKISIQKP